ncbi:RPEL repeat protein [Colletotrichum tofieldiae]|nr:RPEL repeat protein [Colletotrichum tofieldiae]
MADENNTSQPPVDETPISHPPGERKNSLENHLQHRPNRAELVEKNILPASNAAPSLIAHQKELEKHMRADSLNDKISHRPAPEDLIKEGVLKEDPRSAEDKYAEAIEDEYAKREGVPRPSMSRGSSSRPECLVFEAVGGCGAIARDGAPWAKVWKPCRIIALRYRGSAH